MGSYLFVVTIGVGNHLGQSRVGLGEEVLIVLEVRLVLVVGGIRLIGVGNERTTQLASSQALSRDQYSRFARSDELSHRERMGNSDEQFHIEIRLGQGSRRLILIIDAAVDQLHGKALRGQVKQLLELGKVRIRGGFVQEAAEAQLAARRGAGSVVAKVVHLLQAGQRDEIGTGRAVGAFGHMVVNLLGPLVQASTGLFLAEEGRWGDEVD